VLQVILYLAYLNSKYRATAQSLLPLIEQARQDGMQRVYDSIEAVYKPESYWASLPLLFRMNRLRK
jgi:hypothetical protein